MHAEFQRFSETPVLDCGDSNVSLADSSALMEGLTPHIGLFA